IAKLIRSPRFQWIAYIWAWALLDVTVIPLSSGASVLAYVASAVISAQLGIVVVWGIMGTTRWSLRWPAAAAVLAVGMGMPLVAYPYGPHQLALLLATQTAMLLLLLTGLRWRRICLANIKLTPTEGSPAQPAVLAPPAKLTQFNLRDILLWTSLLATLLGLVRALQIPPWLGLRIVSGQGATTI